jgi:hypothetical protein
MKNMIRVVPFAAYGVSGKRTKTEHGADGNCCRAGIESSKGMGRLQDQEQG